MDLCVYVCVWGGGGGEYESYTCGSDSDSFGSVL